MAERRVTLFCEDLGHETFVRALLKRISREEGVATHLEVRNSRGGLGRTVSELRAWQALVARRGGSPDLLIVLVDANSEGPTVRRQLVHGALDPRVFPRWVIGVPDPYVERWFFADGGVFRRVTGCPAPSADALKVSRRAWKEALRDAMDASGDFLLNDVADIAPELVGSMDLHRAGREVPSLGALQEDLRRALRSPA